MAKDKTPTADPRASAAPAGAPPRADAAALGQALTGLAAAPPMTEAPAAHEPEPTVLTDADHERNRVLYLEMELAEKEREIARLKMAKTLGRPAEAPVPVNNEASDPAYNPNGDPDELIRVEAIKSGTYSNYEDPGRPLWHHIQMTGRTEEGGVSFPGRVFRMKREHVNTCMYVPGTGEGWVRVLKVGEEVRAGVPIGRPAPQTTQLGMRVSAIAAAAALPIGG